MCPDRTASCRRVLRAGRHRKESIASGTNRYDEPQPEAQAPGHASWIY